MKSAISLLGCFVFALCARESAGFRSALPIRCSAAAPGTDADSAAPKLARSSRRRRNKFEVAIEGTQETKGGFIVHARCKKGASPESTHTITMSKEDHLDLLTKEGSFPRPVEPEALARAVLTVLSQQGVPLENTEGTLPAWQFPVNYFSVRHLWHEYPTATKLLVDVLRDLDGEAVEVDSEVSNE